MKTANLSSVSPDDVCKNSNQTHPSKKPAAYMLSLFLASAVEGIERTSMTMLCARNPVWQMLKQNNTWMYEEIMSL